MSFLTTLGAAVSKAGTASRLAQPFLSKVNPILGAAAGVAGHEYGLSEALGYPGHPSQQGGSVGADAGANPGGTPLPGGTPSGGGGSGGSGGGVATPNYSALINDNINRLDGQQQTGLDNIARSYQSAFDTLTNQKNQAQQQYDTTKAQTLQDNQTAKDNIASGVRNGLSGLQRLLGAHGAGNSSAASILAPYAAGLQGNQQRQQVQTAFGRNMQGLDTNLNSTMQGITDAFGKLSNDRTSQEQTLRQQILQKRADLLGQMPNPDVNQINALGHQIDSLGAVQSFDPGVHNFQAPDLAQYNYDASQGANVNTPADGADSNVGPFFQLLGKKKQGVGV